MTVLLAVGGASWEAELVTALAAGGVRDVRRCLDVADLVALSEASVARVAVVSTSAAGLDAHVLRRVADAGVQVVTVLDGVHGAVTAARLGAPDGVPAGDLRALTDRVVALTSLAEPDAGDDLGQDGAGSVVAVWGPRGAPGRSTVAAGLAGALASAGSTVLLLDADPAGGTQAQSMGILDEVSGLLSAARAANAGRLDDVAEHAYAVDDRLAVLTGLPRPDLWPRVRAGAFERLLEVARGRWEVVVVDCGDDLGGEETAGVEPPGPHPHHVTRAALEAADVVVACASADPVGLARFVRAVPEVMSAASPTSGPVVVLNRVRESVAWSVPELASTIRRLAGVEPTVALPLDQAVLDRAHVEGRMVREIAPDGRSARGYRRLADAVLAQAGSRDADGVRAASAAS